MINIVKANINDLDIIFEIVNENKKYFRRNNIPQWLDDYPNKEIFLDDLKYDGLFLIKDDNKIIGIFSQRDYEDTYDVIDGKWSSDNDYIVIHRMALKNDYKGKGIAKIVFDHIKKKHSYIRIDTHELNIPMNKCLIKNGFKYCGIIKLHDNSLRNAYDYLKIIVDEI